MVFIKATFKHLREKQGENFKKGIIGAKVYFYVGTSKSIWKGEKRKSRMMNQGSCKTAKFI